MAIASVVHRRRWLRFDWFGSQKPRDDALEKPNGSRKPLGLAVAAAEHGRTATGTLRPKDTRVPVPADVAKPLPLRTLRASGSRFDLDLV